VFYFIYSLALPEDLPEWSWGLTLQRTALLVVAAIPFFLLFISLYEYLQKRRLRTKTLRRRPRNSI
jgi:hypothetical protein